MKKSADFPGAIVSASSWITRRDFFSSAISNILRGRELKPQFRVHDELRPNGPPCRAGVRYAHEDHIVARRVAMLRRYALGARGECECFLDDVQAGGRTAGSHDRDARRKEFLFLPDRVRRHFHGDARSEFVAAFAIMIEQCAVLIDERFARIVRQTDGGLPLRRRMAEVQHADCRGRRVSGGDGTSGS
ncbi:MAG: hypothetical protein NTV46_02715 [Verrucomicrobia bacterium]|nr:hypothetical protein [Verrucomicrobiota bacterium]